MVSMFVFINKTFSNTDYNNNSYYYEYDCYDNDNDWGTNYKDDNSHDTHKKIPLIIATGTAHILWEGRNYICRRKVYTDAHLCRCYVWFSSSTLLSIVRLRLYLSVCLSVIYCRNIAAVLTNAINCSGGRRSQVVG